MPEAFSFWGDEGGGVLKGFRLNDLFSREAGGQMFNGAELGHSPAQRENLVIRVLDCPCITLLHAPYIPSYYILKVKQGHPFNVQL